MSQPQARQQPAVGLLVLLVLAVGAGGFYAGSRYGRGGPDGGPAVPRPVSLPPRPTPATPAPAGVPPSPTAEHFRPRTVTEVSGNFLANPGFEAGDDGWKAMEWSENWGRFEIGSAHVSTGTKAVHLAALGAPPGPPTRVFGVVQEIVSPRFPTRVSGRYYVERWEPGAARKAYLQVVVIALEARSGVPTMQLRYILGGVTEQPYEMSNARYVFVESRSAPALGAWVDFSLDVESDYRRLWGAVPRDGTGYRVLFEARYDDKPPGAAVALDVWYDDLFVGIPEAVGEAR